MAFNPSAFSLQSAPTNFVDPWQGLRQTLGSKGVLAQRFKAISNRNAENRAREQKIQELADARQHAESMQDARFANQEANRLAQNEFTANQTEIKNNQAIELAKLKESLARKRIREGRNYNTAQAAGAAEALIEASQPTTTMVEGQESVPRFTYAEVDNSVANAANSVQAEQDKAIAAFTKKYGFAPNLNKDLNRQIAERRFDTPFLQDVETVGLNIVEPITGVPGALRDIDASLSKYLFNKDKDNKPASGTFNNYQGIKNDFQLIRDLEAGKSNLVPADELKRATKKVLTKKEQKTYKSASEQIAYLGNKLRNTKNQDKKAQIVSAINTLQSKVAASQEKKNEITEFATKEAIKARFKTENKKGKIPSMDDLKTAYEEQTRFFSIDDSFNVWLKKTNPKAYKQYFGSN